jgi:hypothetical protein
MESGSEALRQANLPVEPTAQEGTTVGGQGSPLKIGPDGLTTDRRQIPWRWARLGQKQTAGGFSGMVGWHLPCYQRLTRGLSIFVKNSG